MSRIRSKNTGIELRVRKLLRAAGVRNYRLHAKLPGSPDLVFFKAKTAVFVDGCFWHGCGKCARRAVKTNAAYWTEKISNNRKRDRKNNRLLKEAGWRVIRLKEHEIKADPEKCVKRIVSRISV